MIEAHKLFVARKKKNLTLFNKWEKNTVANSKKLKDDKDYKDDLIIFSKEVEEKLENEKEEERDLDLNIIINKNNKIVLLKTAARNILFKKKK